MIKLRPYHLFAVIRQIATGPTKEDEIFKGIPVVTQRILENPDEELELVECFDDACVDCIRHVPDGSGCVWGKDFSCQSALHLERAYKVGQDMERILRKLDVEWGAHMPAREFLFLAIEKYPARYAENPDGAYRKQYVAGMEKIKAMWK